MSKPARTLYAVSAAAVLCLQIFTNVRGQVFDAKIEIGGASQAAVSGIFIRMDELKNARNFSFDRRAPGLDHPATRIMNLALLDPTGQNINFRKLIDGEYLADRDVAMWRFEMDLAPLKDRAAGAHASWISGERGLLMAGDLLPIAFTSVFIIFGSPVTLVFWGAVAQGIMLPFLAGAAFTTLDILTNRESKVAVGWLFTRLMFLGSGARRLARASASSAGSEPQWEQCEVRNPSGETHCFASKGDTGRPYKTP